MADSESRSTPENIEEFRRRFGRRVAAIRKQRNITQEGLARKMRIDPVFIAYIEGGKRSPSFVTLYGLLKTLGVTPDELFRF